MFFQGLLRPVAHQDEAVLNRLYNKQLCCLLKQDRGFFSDFEPWLNEFPHESPKGFRWHRIAE